MRSWVGSVEAASLEWLAQPVLDLEELVEFFTHSLSLQLTLAMPEPMLIYGSVLDANLEGQGNLLIEVYETFRNERRVICETRTGSDGSFRMIAPAAAPKE